MDCFSFAGAEDARSFMGPFYSRGNGKSLTGINNSAERNQARTPLPRLAPAFGGRLVARAELFHAVLGVGLRLARALHHLHQRLEVVAREQVRTFALDVHADRLGLALRASDDLRERLARAVEHPQGPQRACERLGIHRLVGWTVRHVQPPRLDTSRVTQRLDARRCSPKVKLRRRGEHGRDPGGFQPLADSVWTSLHRAALRSRQRVEHLLHVLDAVLSDLQRERRGTALEAPVAAADGAGGDEALALEAPTPLEMRAALRVAPVDHQRVAQARPARKIDGLAQGPVEPQLAVKTHRAGRTLVGLADVDERVAAVSL